MRSDLSENPNPGFDAPGYYFGPFVVDCSQRRLVRGGSVQKGTIVPLTAKAFDLLLVLLKANGQTVGIDTLMATLWPFNEEANDATLRQHVLMLRRALSDRTQDARYIVTDYGKGYRFVGSVSVGPSLLIQTLVEQLCVAGNEFRESRNEASLQGALELYDRALSIDQNSADPLGAAALCRCLIADYARELPKPLLEQARVQAEAALALNPHCVDALLALTKVFLDYDRDFKRALSTVQLAVLLAPSNCVALFLNAWILVLERRFTDAHAFIDSCGQEFPGVELVRSARGLALLYDREYAPAVAELSALSAEWPDFWLARLALGQALFLAGDVRGALEEFDHIRLSAHDPLVTRQVDVRFMAEAYALYASFRSGDPAKAEESLARLKRSSKQRFIPAYCFALAEAGRKRYQEAAYYVRLSRENRESWYTQLRVEPFLEGLLATSYQLS